MAIINNNSFFNPKNVEELLIIQYLYSEIKGTFDLSYNLQKFNWINDQIQFEDQNQIKLLTIHMYDDAISEYKEEISMKNLKIIGIQKQNLYSTKDYLDALKMITSIELLQQYLQNYIIPIDRKSTRLNSSH